MTTHLRTSLRDAMATAVTGLTSTGSRVHKSRLYPVAADALPCLLVIGLTVYLRRRHL